MKCSVCGGFAKGRSNKLKTVPGWPLQCVTCANKGPTKEEKISEFWSKVQKTESCWIWKGSRAKLGYGMFWGFPIYETRHAHRFSYFVHKGPVPEGLELDHICRNPPCVNPEHLQAVTSEVNTLIGEGITAKNLRKTQCLRGHAYDKENTGLITNKRTGRKGRRCKECDRIRNRIYRKRDREAAYSKAKEILGESS